MIQNCPHFLGVIMSDRSDIVSYALGFFKSIENISTICADKGVNRDYPTEITSAPLSAAQEKLFSYLDASEFGHLGLVKRERTIFAVCAPQARFDLFGSVNFIKEDDDANNSEMKNLSELGKYKGMVVVANHKLGLIDVGSSKLGKDVHNMLLVGLSRATGKYSIVNIRATFQFTENDYL